MSGNSSSSSIPTSYFERADQAHDQWNARRTAEYLAQTSGGTWEEHMPRTYEWLMGEGRYAKRDDFISKGNGELQWIEDYWIYEDKHGQNHLKVSRFDLLKDCPTPDKDDPVWKGRRKAYAQSHWGVRWDGHLDWVWGKPD